MKKYLYIITSQSTGEKYVGKTTNYKRRKGDHIYQLENSRHKNYKLQNLYNKYGIDNFIWEYFEYKGISDEELNEKEIALIKKYDSYKNGLNLTLGGDGGNTVKNRRLNFESFCLAYFGCSTYPNTINRIARYLGVDSSTISAVVRKLSYDDYRQRADKISQKEKETILKSFEEILDLKNKPPRERKPRMTDEFVFQVICVVSSYSRGIEKTINSKFNISKGLMHRCFTKNNFNKAVIKYSKLSKEEIVQNGEKFFKEWNLKGHTPEYRDLFLHYKVNRP